MIRLPEVATNSIKVGDRVRRDMGDVDALAESIRMVGLLHAPIVTPSMHLLAGERRLEAIKRLGWETVPVRVVESAKSLADELAIEGDENTCRKDFTPSEAAVLREKRADALRKLAEANQKATQAKKGEGKVGGGNLPPPTDKVGKVRDAAAAGTGFSGRTLDKVDQVREAVASADPAVAKAAAEALDEIESTGKVDRAFKKVAAAEHEAMAQADPMLGDQRYRYEVAKAIEKAGSLFSLDAARCAAVADDDQLASWTRHWERADKFRAAFEAAVKADQSRKVRTLKVAK